MKTSYFYIQRLNPPYNGYGVPSKANPFSFGGGKPNGGLSTEAFKLLSQCWSYDYMGSAEFEFGALPESWERIKEKYKKYRTGSCEITATATEYGKNGRGKQTVTGTVYFFCHKDDITEMQTWLAKFANEEKHEYHSKEYIGLGSAICFPDKRGARGWHDINNDYLFFTEKEMFDTMCTVLEIKQTN